MELASPMRVFLTGGTGLIGRRLVQRLLERGDQPVILSRRADQARLDPRFKGAEIVQGDPMVPGGWNAAVEGCDAVVNLVGHNIFAERWSEEVRRKIRDSRVVGTDNLVAALAPCARRPGVLVSSSAIGYYGPHGDEILTESSPPGTDFMAEVCVAWEAAARAAEALGVRVALIRTGIVLARDEGALGVMTPIFKRFATPVGSGPPQPAQELDWANHWWKALWRYYVAPVFNSLAPVLKPGTGRQWMSWIHIEDIVGLFLLALDHPAAQGPLNGTAPEPVRNAEFSRALARALRQRKFGWPPYVPFGPPDALLGIVLGDVAQVITTGQRVVPERAQALGYTFRFPGLVAALDDLFPKPANLARNEPIAASA
jgi:uncharacterized protein (TIGR01777 family)